MDQIKWFHEELLLFPLNATTSEEAIQSLGSLLVQHGYVKDTFIPAVLERERNFATGLPTDPFGVAIPHTDAHHILKPAIAVGISPKPIEFREMGDPEGAIVEVRVVLMLAMPDPTKVTSMLQRLVSILQSPDFIEPLVNAQDLNTVKTLLANRLNP